MNFDNTAISNSRICCKQGPIIQLQAALSHAQKGCIYFYMTFLRYSDKEKITEKKYFL